MPAWPFLAAASQQVLRPDINGAAIRLLTRFGIETVLAKGEGCCGALLHHLGKEAGALFQARQNVDVWSREIEGHGLDAILITASGCGTMIKDYGFLLRNDPAYAAKAARVSALAKDVTEFLGTLDLPEPARPTGLIVAYHSACSMQHGQKIDALPRRLLTQAGFKVRDIPEGHLCCGSAGTYNILEPEIAVRLRDRKIANIVQTCARSRRHRKHRLHRSDRERHIDPGAPYDRTSRLRPWRANAGWPREPCGLNVISVEFLDTGGQHL